MIGKTLNFVEVHINKKEFHTSKQPIGIHSVEINRIVISDKFKHSNKGNTYCIGYAEDNIKMMLR